MIAYDKKLEQLTEADRAWLVKTEGTAGSSIILNVMRRTAMNFGDAKDACGQQTSAL